MKKIILLFTLLVFFTGCSIKNINNSDISDIITDALNTTDDVTNVVAEGYKFYLPRGMKVVNKKSYNYQLLSNGMNYYLYVDLISYYHKTKVEYSTDTSAYFSKKISYDGKDGYVTIKSIDNGRYYLQIAYNYAKIEAYVDSNYLNSSIYDSIRILSSVTYNDTIVETLVGDSAKETDEEEFNLFDSKREDGSFLDWVEEYGTYNEDNTVKDEDFLDVNK